jgi:alpha-beta hydrolase superfamily lysophospholipase
MTLGAGISETEGWYEGAGGTRLFYRSARPPAERATVVCLHGIGDHSGLYPMVFETLVPLGFGVVAPDLRGNGRSPGPRGHVDRWTDFRDDLRRLIAGSWSGGPLFLLGNSMGGLVALDYGLEHPGDLRGIVAVAPPLGRLGVPAPLLAMGRVLSRVWPRFSLETGMDLTGLARDPAVTERVLADPLFHRRGTARLSTELTEAIARVRSGAAHYPVPVLVLHGGADRMVPPDGSRQFVAAAHQPNVRMIEYPGAYHALLADLGGSRVLADLAAWLAQHL